MTRFPCKLLWKGAWSNIKPQFSSLRYSANTVTTYSCPMGSKKVMSSLSFLFLSPNLPAYSHTAI